MVLSTKPVTVSGGNFVFFHHFKQQGVVGSNHIVVGANLIVGTNRVLTGTAVSPFSTAPLLRPQF